MANVMQTEKTELRKEKLRLRRELDAQFRRAADQAISRTLEALPEYQEAAVIAAYSSDGTEVDLTELLRKCRREGKTICRRQEYFNGRWKNLQMCERLIRHYFQQYLNIQRRLSSE